MYKQLFEVSRSRIYYEFWFFKLKSLLFRTSSKFKSHIICLGKCRFFSFQASCLKNALCWCTMVFAHADRRFVYRLHQTLKRASCSPCCRIPCKCSHSLHHALCFPDSWKVCSETQLVLYPHWLNCLECNCWYERATHLPLLLLLLSSWLMEYLTRMGWKFIEVIFCVSKMLIDTPPFQ